MERERSASSRFDSFNDEPIELPILSQRKGLLLPGNWRARKVPTAIR